MSVYEEAQKVRAQLVSLIDERIACNAAVKSAIKARKATVTTAPTDGVVGVTLIGDKTELKLPYNSQFTDKDLTVGTVVSVWYNYSLNNGIVMQNNNWSQTSVSPTYYCHEINITGKPTSISALTTTQAHIYLYIYSTSNEAVTDFSSLCTLAEVGTATKRFPVSGYVVVNTYGYIPADYLAISAKAGTANLAVFYATGSDGVHYFNHTFISVKDCTFTDTVSIVG